MTMEEIKKDIKKCKNCGTECYSIKTEYKCTKCGYVNGVTIAYQCSKCANLEDMDDYVMCSVGIDPRPNCREKGDAKLCRENFQPVEKVWHEKFSWE